MSTAFVSNPGSAELQWVEQSRREWIATFDSILDFIVIRDSAGCILRINRALAEAFGKSPRLIVGSRLQGVDDFHHGKVVESPRLRCEGVADLDLEGAFMVSRSEIGNSESGLNAEVIVLRDVTLLQQMQANLRDSEKAATIQALAGGIAHEIANPMVIISGRSDLMLSDATLPREIRTQIEIIQRQVTRVMELTRTLKDLSSPKTTTAPCDLNSVIDEVVAFMSYEFSRHKIKIDRRYSPIPMAEVNRGQIIQVLINALGNARDAMPSGGRITISSAHADGHIRLSMADTGAGIKPEHLKQLFTPFFTTKAPGKGTGLGLHICREIARHHGGSVSLESKPGHGTTFHLTLPAA